MKKLLFSMMLVLALLAGQTGVAFAQDPTPPPTDTPTAPITGTVQTATLETDTAGITTVLVTYTYTDSAGATQTATARLSVETAASLGLVTTDPTTNITTVNDTAVGTTVTIDPSTVIPDPTTTEEEPQHPVGGALSDFFSELLGVDYDTIMEYHDNGTGFGVIAQALWMTNQLGGDTSMFTALLDAKKSGDYSAITLADGSTPKNWGEVVKSLKKGSNLGSVKSGKASADDTTTTEKQHGNSGKEKTNGKQNTEDGKSGKGNGGGNGKGNGGGKGNGKP